MPIYEYRCASCAFQKEYLQKVSDPVLSDCPECGKPTFNKMLTAAGFQLKGSGWYATDFKNGAASKAAEPAKSGEATTAAAEKSEAGTDSKSDKSDSKSDKSDSKSDATSKESKPAPSTESKSAASPAPAPATGSSSS